MLTPADQEELERLAVDAHARAGSDPREPETPIALARVILGRDNVRTVDPQWLPGDGALARVGDRWQTWIRRGLSPSRLSFAVAHELAEFLLRETPLENEHAANFMGAAIVAPRPYFHALAREPNLPELAREIVTSETMIALRWGEVTGQPTLVITKSYQWRRGGPWAWPAEARTAHSIRGARRIRFKDAPERRAFLAEE